MLFGKLAPIHIGQRETKERGKTLQIAGSFNQQGNLTWLVLCGCKTSRSPHLCAGILKLIQKP